jgi:hypothetical protein
MGVVCTQELTNGDRPEQNTNGGECEERDYGGGDFLYDMCLKVDSRVGYAAALLCMI